MDSSNISPSTPNRAGDISRVSSEIVAVNDDRDPKRDAFSQAPTAVPTPRLSRSSSALKKEAANEKSNGAGVILTATNTIDTLTLDGQQKGQLTDSNDNDIRHDLSKASTARKLLLLSMFTLAEFLDAFNNSALFPAIPIISTELSFDATETVWIVSAYQLTFAAFLLVSGRISDVYTPKPAFIVGCLTLGITHLIGGFTHQKIALLVLRALGGIGGALTIPSALSLIVQLFPDPSHQARAISLFGSAGAIGNVLGILIGAVLVQYTSWSWIFWFVAIVGISIGAICLFLIPNAIRDKELNVKFDAPGVSLLTVSVILFIFAVTSGSTKGWGTAYVLAPLLISILLFVLFLVWEAHTPPDDAVLPPRMWRFRNFGVLVGLALLPYLWWVTSFIELTSWWEQVFGWTAINTAVHFLPMGIGAFLVSQITGRLPTYFAHKYILLFGLGIAIIATILQPFGDSPDTYWPFVFPAFLLGTSGMMIVYANSSIAIFSYTPPSVAGTVGAVFNCALQLGSAVGLAAVSSITTSVDSKTPPLNPPLTEFPHRLDEITKDTWKAAFQGRAASFWFLLGVLSVLLVCVIVFFKVDIPEHHEEEEEKKKDDVEAAPVKH
ncbi:hypothetical protein M408DRAFT_333459 [Serendipita vermifera MAFF 305830]|uniref:Major facilitator superfamily (MFS) profile domain-containing protein n=1 Tax=Serendipita vermifera MAFF 305830 TaxID=933852 RepID=A0A0C2W4N7_SERVB|nr:hypothetical protein M408DRAFT_333459 [Serendipita vermifera MAFF 305830]